MYKMKGAIKLMTLLLRIDRGPNEIRNVMEEALVVKGKLVSLRERME